MRKFLSIVLAAAMISAFFVTTAFADGTLEEIIAAYTADSFTDGESELAVTKNLLLNSSFGSGVTASWSSSNSDIIAPDGTVTRDLTEKKTVTMTLTLSKNGEENVSKDFTYTILPLTAKVYASEPFASKLEPAATSFSDTASGWTDSNNKKTLEYSVLSENTTNSRYARISRKEANSTDYSMTTYIFNDYEEMTKAEGYIDIKIPKPSSEIDSSEYYDIQIKSETNKPIATLQFVHNKQYGVAAYLNSTGKGYNFACDTWYTMHFTIDRSLATNDSYVEIIDKKTGTAIASQKWTSNATGTKIKGISIVPARNNTYGREIDMDNLIAINTDLSLIPDVYKVAAAVELTEGELTGNVTLPTKGEAEALAGATVDTFTWSSNNTAVLGNDGTVKRPYFNDADVTLTLTVAKGSDSLEKVFNFKVLAMGKTQVYSEDFEKENLNQTRFRSYDDLTPPRVILTVDPAEGSAKGKVISTSRLSGDTKSPRISLSLGGDAADGIVTVESEFYFAAEGETQAPSFMFDLRGRDTAAARNLIFGPKFDYGKGKLYLTSLGKEYTVTKQLPALNEWHTLKIVLDTASDTGEIYIDGNIVNTTPIPMQPVEKDTVNFDYMYAYIESGYGRMYLNDFRLIKNTDADSLSAMGAVNNALKPFANGITSGAAISGDVEWTAADPDFNASIENGKMSFTNSVSQRDIVLSAKKNVNGAVYERAATVAASPAFIKSVYVNTDGAISVDVCCEEPAIGKIFLGLYSGNTLKEVKVNPAVSTTIFSFTKEIAETDEIRAFILNDKLTPLAVSQAK